MISIRQSIDDDERLARNGERQVITQRFQALIDLFEGLANAIPKTAASPSAEFSEHCRSRLLQAAAMLKNEPSHDDIGQAKAAALSELDGICRSNRLVLEERDAALRDVISTVAGAVSGFKGHGERQESSLGKLADGFEALTRIQDPGELRRQLRRNVAELRHSVEEIRRESNDSLRVLDAQVRAFEQRLESARTSSHKDRLTGLGSRREAERRMHEAQGSAGPICVLLFDIEGFHEINSRYGAIFGDKLLQALAHTLVASFPDRGTVFRWGADEFLVLAEGPLAARAVQARSACGVFANQRYTVCEGSAKKSVGAQVASGAAEFVPGETIESLHRRAQANLEQGRMRRLR